MKGKAAPDPSPVILPDKQLPDPTDAYTEIGATSGPYKELDDLPLQRYPTPAVGSEEAANGSNPPALPCATSGYSKNAAGVHGTELSKPANTSSAAVSDFLGGGRRG